VRSDGELAASIRHDVIYRWVGLDPTLFSVVVKDGVATISGHVDHRSTASMIERSVAMVPGVVGVHATITWSIDDRRPADRLEPMLPIGLR
jgi:hypothetical protein